MHRTVAVMMGIMLVGKGMGVVRDILQGRYLGAGTVEGIAFMQASTLPRHFFDILFASVFSASFIPIFNQILQTKGRKAAFDLAACFIGVVATVAAAVTVLCIVFAAPLYDAVLGGAALADGVRPLGIQLLRVMLPLMAMSALAFSLTGVLQSLGEFRIPAAMSVASNGIILVYYFFFFDRFGLYGLCAAFLIGWGSQIVIQIPFLRKNQFSFRFRFDFKHPALRQIGALTLPVMAASWVGPVNLMINGKAVNMYGQAYDYTAINFAYVLFSIISGVFVLSVANVIFPVLSRQAAVDDTRGFNDTLQSTFRSLLFFLLPMTFGLMALSTPIIRLLYYGGLFNNTAVQVTGNALFYFSLGTVGYGLQIVLSRVCYARQDGRTPLAAALTAIAINAALSFWLVSDRGAGGVALASSIAITAGAAVMLVFYAYKGYIRFSGGLWLDTGKMLVLSLAMFGAVYLLTPHLNIWLVVAVGAALYLGLARLCGLREMRNLKGFFVRG